VLREILWDEKELCRAISGSDLEQAHNELRPPRRISFRQPFGLTFSHHVHGFHAFQPPLRRVEGVETLRRPPPPPDDAVILFDHVLRYLTRRSLQSNDAPLTFKCGHIRGLMSGA